jgi:hypothetical protein
MGGGLETLQLDYIDFIEKDISSFLFTDSSLSLPFNYCLSLSCKDLCIVGSFLSCGLSFVKELEIKPSLGLIFK